MKSLFLSLVVFTVSCERPKIDNNIGLIHEGLDYIKSELKRNNTAEYKSELMTLYEQDITTFIDMMIMGYSEQIKSDGYKE